MLRLAALGSTAAKQLSSAAALRLDGGTISDPELDGVIAWLADGCWTDGSDEYSRIDIHGPLEIFSVDGNCEAKFGTFPAVNIEGELLHAPWATIGRLAQSEWELFSTHVRWPVLLLRSVPES